MLVASVRVTGAGRESRVHLPSGKVDKPTFERNYSAANGTMAAVPVAGP